ncbi:MAG: 2-phospho-L-lactate transferase [Deltaproteobacteria bacterium]|nr:2-phospho-L-lactate transferase [Deltaproteobacteria bacterium]
MENKKQNNSAKFIAVSGGVGGAKLALGLEKIIQSEDLMVIGNVGDDFRHFGLHVSPDIDTLLYTLSGKSDIEKGWGLANETWEFMSAMKELGGDTWFQLGDQDLATHVERTRRLQDGQSLSEITDYFRRTFGIGAKIIPATDDHLRTIVETDIGVLNFQEYFVRERCKPRIQNLHFQGSESAFPLKELTKALKNKDLLSIIFCPSNPLLSIDPILSIQGLKKEFADSGAKIVAVTPIVGGAAIKGPAAKNLRELGYPVSATTVAKHYQGLIHGFVLDQRDHQEAKQLEKLGIAVLVADTIMNDIEAKIQLAEKTLKFAKSI